MCQDDKAGWNKRDKSRGNSMIRNPAMCKLFNLKKKSNESCKDWKVAQNPTYHNFRNMMYCGGCMNWKDNYEHTRHVYPEVC